MKPFDLHGLKTYDLASRPSKVFVEDLGQPVGAGASVGDWIDSLPRQLAGNDLRRVRDHVCRACRDGRTVVAALGGHVIKTGCAPYLLDWIRTGTIHPIAMNGSAAIPDFHLAASGKTIAAVEVVDERHDVVTRASGGDSLLDRSVHARCSVRRCRPATPGRCGIFLPQ